MTPTAPVIPPAQGDDLEPEVGLVEAAALAATEENPVPLYTTIAAAVLSSMAAGWMVSGMFRGALPHVVATAGVVVGCAVVLISQRSRREAVQWLVLPAAIVMGLALTVPFATGGTSNALSLVVEAIRQGGLARPPVPFDPGWRLIMVVVFALVGASAAAMALATNRAKLAVLIPVPLAGAAALVQPPGSEITASIFAAALVTGALALAQGAELARHAEVGAGFEVRRLLRGGAMVAGLVVLLLVLNNTGFLFPQPVRQQVVPPQRPELPPPTPDRPLFYATTTKKLTYRLGVIDSYTYDAAKNDGAWLLPPYDTNRFKKVSSNFDFNHLPDYPSKASAKLTVAIRIAEATGHQLPDLPGMESVRNLDFAADYDPLSQTMRLTDDRVRKGMTFDIVAAAPPSGAELEKADAAPPSMDAYKQAPRAPSAVLAALADAPSNKYDRLYFARKALYDHVIASGVGKPVDVNPDRVVQMLKGGEATPYEITAAEALMARWAGLPARIGYGYYGGAPQKDGTVEIRPRHGSTWLEVYFSGYGWVPIIGDPPQAKASTRSQARNENLTTKASKNFDLLVYVPIRENSILQYYDYARYYALVSLPFIAILAVLYFFYPGAFKYLRTVRRTRWARKNGVAARVAVAYCNFRDTCSDLNIGDPAATPLEFTRYLRADPEVQELAWLATRALWGDLARDLREEDAAAAEEYATSVRKRVVAAQPVLNRVLAVGARASLVTPYSHEVPNLWRSSGVRPAGQRLGQRVAAYWKGRGRRRLARLGRT